MTPLLPRDASPSKSLEGIGLRAIDCARYDACLLWVVHQDWHGWSCAGCPHAAGAELLDVSRYVDWVAVHVGLLEAYRTLPRERTPDQAHDAEVVFGLAPALRTRQPVKSLSSGGQGPQSPEGSIGSPTGGPSGSVIPGHVAAAAAGGESPRFDSRGGPSCAGGRRGAVGDAGHRPAARPREPVGPGAPIPEPAEEHQHEEPTTSVGDRPPDSVASEPAPRHLEAASPVALPQAEGGGAVQGRGSLLPSPDPPTPSPALERARELLGRLLTNLRITAWLSRCDVAWAIGQAPSQIHSWERGDAVPNASGLLDYLRAVRASPEFSAKIRMLAVRARRRDRSQLQQGAP